MRTITMLFVSVLLISACQTANDVSYNLSEIKGGTDDRELVDSGLYPWSAIGRVTDKATTEYCTGVLIGPSIALTVAHCLYNKKTKKFKEASQLVLEVGFSTDALPVTAAIESFYVPDDYQEGVPPTGGIAAHDWALLKLRSEIGSQVGWFGIKQVRRNILKEMQKNHRKFSQAGYSADNKLQLTAHIDCAIKGYAKGLELLVHQCDAIDGDAGSPLFVLSNGMPYLIGIHVATTIEVQPVYGVAVPSSAFIEILEYIGLGEPFTLEELG